MPGRDDAKQDLRRTMRPVRRAACGQDVSTAIVERLSTIPEIMTARTVMSFIPLPGEPDLTALIEMLARRGTTVVAPASDPAAPWPIAPDAVDVVVVPGVAFARDGHRLGQGGGWYDRFLADVRQDCLVIGACFDEQLVDTVPVDPHDVRVDLLVTPTRTLAATTLPDDDGAVADS